MTRRKDQAHGDPRATTPGSTSARILPFAPRRPFAPGPRRTPPARRPAGLVATMSIDAKEVARLVARDLADAWVHDLIADHQRRSGPPAPCGAPRRHPPHAPCRRTGRPLMPTAGAGGIKGRTRHPPRRVILRRPVRVAQPTHRRPCACHQPALDGGQEVLARPVADGLEGGSPDRLDVPVVYEGGGGSGPVLAGPAAGVEGRRDRLIASGC